MLDKVFTNDEIIGEKSYNDIIIANESIICSFKVNDKAL